MIKRGDIETSFPHSRPLSPQETLMDRDFYPSERTTITNVFKGRILPRAASREWKDDYTRNHDVAKTILLELETTRSKLQVEVFDNSGRYTPMYKRLVFYVNTLFKTHLKESQSSSQYQSSTEKILPKVSRT